MIFSNKLTQTALIALLMVSGLLMAKEAPVSDNTMTANQDMPLVLEQRHAKPYGFDFYAVVMADAIYDFFVDGEFPFVGEHFLREITGRNDEEVAEFRTNAIAHFEERFGINPDAPEMADRVIMVPFTMDSRDNFSAFSLSDENAPPEGFEIEEGGYMLVILDPEGMTLGGAFEGRHVPVNTNFLFGEYWFFVEQSHPYFEGISLGKTREIVMPYKSLLPQVPDANGMVTVRFLMTSEEYGEGILVGNVLRYPISEDGRIYRSELRGVITFPVTAHHLQDLE